MYPGETLFRARNGTAALARTPALPEATRVGALSAEAVGKHGEFLRLAEQREVLRDFSASERSEGSKKRTK